MRSQLRLSAEEFRQLHLCFKNNLYAIISLEKMGNFLHTKLNPPSAITGTPSRNAPCPCGSGRKYKNCCGK